jgi:glycosyltransferase involved in cell wall biosynthesis
MSVDTAAATQRFAAQNLRSNKAVGQVCRAKPMRVLHVVGGMDRGGVETWLMHVLRQIDPSELQMDFLVHTDRACAYDKEIEALRSNIYFCPEPANPLRYAMNFRRILRTHGPYDVIHSHVHHFSGFALSLAKLLGIPKRIAHSHTDKIGANALASWPRRAYLAWSERLIRHAATSKLAASMPAAKSLYGANWSSDPKTRVLYCGVDFTPFGQEVDTSEVRHEFGLTDQDFVLGHVGRFVEEKNHRFLLSVYRELREREPDAKLLLVGIGSLESAIRQTAAEMDLLDGIRFAGLRNDVPGLMLGAMDAFVFPSTCEGLGLAAVEAQAAGLHTILSNAVPAEADAGWNLVRFLDLACGPEVWAEAALNSRSVPRTRVSTQALRNSRFSIDVSWRNLYDIYRNV